jgi:large subunit ribosomal protein L17
MRHGRKVNKLGRTSSHRKAMMSNLANSLITHKKINTTLAKAKALKKYVEPLLTKSKSDTTHSRRTVFAYLKSKEAVQELFKEVAPKIANRPGGYTRILKTGNRLGDNAEMCFIELVDFNQTYVKETKTTKAKTRRGRSKAKASDTPVAENTAADTNQATGTAEASEPKAEAKATAKKTTAKKSEKKDNNTDDKKSE